MWSLVSDCVITTNNRGTWHVLQTNHAGAFERVHLYMLPERRKEAGVSDDRLCLLADYHTNIDSELSVSVVDDRPSYKKKRSSMSKALTGIIVMIILLWCDIPGVQ